MLISLGAPERFRNGFGYAILNNRALNLSCWTQSVVASGKRKGPEARLTVLTKLTHVTTQCWDKSQMRPDGRSNRLNVYRFCSESLHVWCVVCHFQTYICTWKSFVSLKLSSSFVAVDHRLSSLYSNLCSFSVFLHYLILLRICLVPVSYAKSGKWCTGIPVLNELHSQCLDWRFRCRLVRAWTGFICQCFAAPTSTHWWPWRFRTESYQSWNGAQLTWSPPAFSQEISWSGRSQSETRSHDRRCHNVNYWYWAQYGWWGSVWSERITQQEDSTTERQENERKSQNQNGVYWQQTQEIHHIL